MGTEAAQGGVTAVQLLGAMTDPGRRREEESRTLWNLRGWPGLFQSLPVGLSHPSPSYSKLKISAAGPGGWTLLSPWPAPSVHRTDPIR